MFSISKFNIGQKGVVHIALFLLAGAGVLAYLILTNTVTFNDGLFSRLFPKPSSYAQGGPSVADEILVKFKPGVPQSAREKILNSHALEKVDSIPAIEVELTKVPPQARDQVLEALNNNPLVEYAEPNFLAEELIEPNDPAWVSPNAQWGLKKIGAAAAWDISRGDAGTTVAISDSGMMLDHEDLTGKAVDSWNVLTNTTDVTDVNGHGTIVSGIAAALTDNAKGIAALGWLNPIMPVKAIRDDGNIYYSDGAKTIIYAADHSAKVINMSWGGTSSSLTLQDAINYAWGKGMVLAAASGNSGTLGVYFPARADNVIAVGATDGSDLKANFSSFGPELDVTAPGVGIYSTAINGSYGPFSGTSVATPFVSALSVLIFSANPGLSNAQVVDIITSTALDLGDTGWDEMYGWGRIQADMALQEVVGVGTTAPPADITLPATSITQPTAGATVSGIIDITSDASDNVGVTKVEFYVDGSLHATDVLSPYLSSWDTTLSADGSHNLQTKAYDLAGNVGSSQVVTVNVSNPTPTSTPTPNMGILTGTVVDGSSNAPIGGATVDVKLSGSKGKSGLITSIFTNPDGSYTLSLTANTYDITVNASGYSKQTNTVTVNLNQTATLNFSLNPSGGGPAPGKGKNR